MQNPFKKKTSEPTPSQPAATGGFDINNLRKEVFTALSNRVGAETAAALREDFDAHIAEDPVHGVEMAYVCLCGKLVDVVDRFESILNRGPASQNEAPISPFTMYRKDA